MRRLVVTKSKNINSIGIANVGYPWTIRIIINNNNIVIIIIIIVIMIIIIIINNNNKYDLPRAEQWYNHKPEGVTENESIKVLWDFNINTDYEIEHRRPDIVVVLKPEKEC